MLEELRACYPQVPLAAQQSLGIALLSYHGKVDIGLLADLDVRDLPALAGAMRDALAELRSCADSRPPAAVGTSAAGGADAQTPTI